VAWRSLFLPGMPDPEPLPSRRGRRVLIALLILLLLPLYLWSLRGGLGGLPGATALPGSVRDPRSAAAVARIPGDVWDALMGYVDAPPPSPPATKAPRNLTMITEAEEIAGSGLDRDTSGAPLFDNPSSLARGLLAHPGGSSDLSASNQGGAETPSTPVEFLADSPSGGLGGGTGAGNPWTGFGPGGYFGPLTGGRPGGGGPRFSGPGPTFDPSNPGVLEPTPEPATLVLVGSNLALLGVAAWKRHRRRLPTPSTG
jgi:PEP-CTERM motif